MKLTRVDLNSWIIEIAEKRLLVDPWLVDPLVFGNAWFIELRHATPLAYTPETLPPIDLLLISQGQPDHCHRPTLERLDRQIPAVVSAAAAPVLRELGFLSVQVLDNFAEFRLGELVVTAVPGAEVQFQRENGYLLEDSDSGEKIYYEPHQARVLTLKQLAERGAIDVLLMPVVGLRLPLLGEVVNGPESALAMAKVLQPAAIVPTTLGEVRSSGLLGALFQPIGTVAEFEAGLRASGLTSRLLCPKPGETIELTFTHRQ
ncbi:MBL fold metallo-hydrolase [Gloeobacter kilaueensis]|uniref:MBL fold metallo-hydrolase n=1 Tax=Gloeobacter kilaueensis (strain ATCC BAA-2537 / CCAP 1431/1 / ULC 316 / JS1) TaxID=1183438 RepID=U5QIA9_GLOK1|nr:MBL fold metallo-hydrolase [Gloeobacter kilaueensis]AGY58727.1 hypothetical protein GKIL_2481 [Gloeobacter kilaueensis JS1]